MSAANDRCARAARPRRRLRSEIPRIAAVLVLPAVLAAVFPYDALSFRAAPAARPASACSFVALSPETESRLLAEARAAWHTRAGASGVRRLDLFAEPLPVEEGRELAGISLRPRAPQPAVADFDPSLLPPTRALAGPVRLPVDPKAGTVKSAFSREELLLLEPTQGGKEKP